MDEHEMECAIKLKEDEEEFILDTIDRYCTNDTSKLPKKMVEEDFKDQKRVIKNKKEEEAIIRRRKKALRISNKIIEKRAEDEENEDASRLIRKSCFKRTKHKPRVVFGRAQENVKIPKGKGRVVFLDRRMKKDKKIKK